MKNVSKSFFIISFLPALAYWYLESYYPIRVAVTGGLVLACLEMFLEKVFTKHLHSLSKFNFFLIAFLGAISLIGDEGIWFKLQPMFTGLGIGAYLLYKVKVGKGLLYEMMESLNQVVPPVEIIRNLETHLGFLFVLYGMFMGLIAGFASTDYWLFFKTAGFYMVFFLFMACEIIWLRLSLRKKYIAPTVLKRDGRRPRF
ncbi:MAG: septation protein IspZ [Bacteriovoracaceae bacterium]|nr:septation protein IspZ [Bacteriovoracaceae bacterium]